jgi:hypothetical protein
MRKINSIIVLLCIGLPTAAAPPTASLIAVQKIWDKAPHCAFTDLAYWKGQFVCAFREGRAHVSTDGRIRVLTSPDGDKWTSAAVISLDGFDLRDAGLSITPDNRLMLNGGAAPRKSDKDSAPTGTFVAFSDDGKTWTKPEIVVEPGRWLWRVIWHAGTRHTDQPGAGSKAYGIAYASVRPLNADLSTQLLTSDDGLKYKELVPKLFGEGTPTEATLRFAKDGTLYCLQRRDGEPRWKSAVFGASRPPYTDWKWHDLGMHVGGPNFIQLPSGKWIAAGRFFNEKSPKTKLAWLDVEENTIEPTLELPSGGDTSYPGLVYHDGMLWMSYYSSHEGKANIYLAKVRVE